MIASAVPLLGLLLLLPGHLVEHFVDCLPAQYCVGNVPVGLHAENGPAQHVAFDVCIVRTVARHDIVKLFFEARPAAFHFMKEKGFTFPVLPASSFVTGLLDMVAIPQNWILDARGDWRWTGAPAVPDA